MKIDIGPYRNHITTHRIKCNYLELMYGDDWYDVTEEKYIWIDHIVVGILDGIDFCLKPLNKFRSRKVKIKYHDYDTWNLDYTLALIIAPGLKQLKATNHGFGHVDDDDLPTACLKEACGEERWEWIMDEMIWAFEQHGDEDDTDQYHYNRDQLEMVFADDSGGRIARFNDQKDPNKPAYFRDDEGLKKHEERKANGIRLFAKYYKSLWD
jgi:hypothetical protein